MKKIHMLTSNRGKLIEIRARFAEIGYSVVQLDLPHPEIQSDSLDEVVVFKGAWVRKSRPGISIIVDDSGLFVDALDGFPGVYSSYAYHTIGCDGILRLLKGEKNRRARFECCICYSAPHLKEQITLKGICTGTISEAEKGNRGFGFDPIFIPAGKKVTFAQMDVMDKNKISHRGRAIEMLIKYLAKK